MVARTATPSVQGLAPDSTPASPFRARATLALTAVGVFMVILDALVVVTALPLIHRDVGGDASSLQWILSGYLLVFGAGILTAATLGDRFGRVRLFVVGLLIFAISSAACALAPNLTWLIAARVVQGVGAAIVTPLSFSLLVAAFPPERRGSVLGIFGGIGGVAVAAGPVVGGAITQALNWHWIFWINVPIGVLVAVLSSHIISESRGPETALDLPGAGLSATSSLALLWGLSRGSIAGWTSPEILASFAVGISLLAAFVAWERRTKSPMIPLRLFGNRSFSAANVVGFLSLGALLSAAFFMSQYFQLVLGYSPVEAGLRFLPWTATPLLIAPLAGRLADRTGPRPLMVAGLMLQALGLGLIALIATADVNYLALVIPAAIAGIGISMVLPAVPLSAFGSVSKADLGKASGVLNSMQRFGGAFVIAMATVAFTSAGHLGSAAGFMAGFRPALEVSIGFSVLGAVVALAVSNKPIEAKSRADVESRAGSSLA